MKKITLGTFSLLLILGLCACGSNNKDKQEAQKQLDEAASKKQEATEYYNSARIVTEDEELSAKIKNQDGRFVISVKDFDGFYRVIGTDSIIEYAGEGGNSTVDFQLYENYPEKAVLSFMTKYAGNETYQNELINSAEDTCTVGGEKYTVLKLEYKHGSQMAYQYVFCRTLAEDIIFQVSYIQYDKVINMEDLTYLLDGKVVSIKEDRSKSAESSKEEDLTSDTKDGKEDGITTEENSENLED